MRPPLHALPTLNSELHPSPHTRALAESTDRPSTWHAHRCVGAFIWFAWGYGTAYHTADGEGNPFIGLPGKAHGAVGWVLDDESTSGADFVSWWFQCEPHAWLSLPTQPSLHTDFPQIHPSPPPASADVFAATGATIVSGAMAERAQLGAA